MLRTLTDMAQVSQDLHVYGQTQARREDAPRATTRARRHALAEGVAAVQRIADAIASGRGGQIVFAEQLVVHGLLKDMLIAKGIKPEEIGIINATATPDSASRQELGRKFNKARSRSSSATPVRWARA